MTRITDGEVRHVAKLARLQLSDEEVATLTGQLEVILEHSGAISAIDTQGIEPTSHPLAMTNVLRDDVVKESLSQEAVLSNAPAAENGRFKVPQIVGDDA